MLLVAALFLGGRYLVFSAYMKSQKRDFRKTVLSRNDAQVIKVMFSASELFKDQGGFEWKEDNKELVIDGRYHEVVSIEESGDSYIVSIVEDTAETALFLNFFNQSQHDSQPGWISLLFALNYLVPIQYCISTQSSTDFGYQHSLSDTFSEGFRSEKIKPPLPDLYIAG